MKKCFGFVLALCAMAALTAGSLEARPGGGARGAVRGGARPRGTFNPGATLGGSKFDRGSRLQGPTRFGDGQFAKPAADRLGSGQLSQTQSARSSSRVGAAQDKVSQLQANYSSKNEPFTPAWYADHPRAWRYTHPHADAWAVATLGATAAWLGAGGVYPAGEVVNVYTSDEETEPQEPLADEPATTDEPAAAELAARGAVDLPNDTEFLSLGVYALAPAEQYEATALVQLSATRDGILRGTYVDLLTDAQQTVVGAVDKESQRAAWTLGEQGPVVFETTLASLTQPEGPLWLEFADGSRRQYTLARYETQTSERE